MPRPAFSVTPEINSRLSVEQVTNALQSALDAAGKAGGTVVVPAGTWTITTLFLRSKVTLHLSAGATLAARTEVSDYPRLRRGHNKDRQPYHLIVADACSDVTIEGPGAIDGNGAAFWNPPLADPSQGAVGLFYREKKQRVSPLLELSDCSQLRLADFTIRNSSGWTVHLMRCDHVQVAGITIDNHLLGPNTDGLDINGCSDVLISGCSIRCGDDAIVVKTTEDARPSERIRVADCTLQSNCAALAIGAETCHDIRDVRFSDCTVTSALRVIQIEMWDAATVEGITFSNITSLSPPSLPLDRPIYLDIQAHGRADGALGSMRRIAVTNLRAQTRGRIVMTAKDGTRIEEVTLQDIALTYPAIEDPEFTVNKMTSSQMSNDSPASRAQRAAIVADNVDGLTLRNVSVAWPANPGHASPLVDGEFPGLWNWLPMRALFCRNVKNAEIDAPELASNQPGLDSIESINSLLSVRSIGNAPPSNPSPERESHPSNAVSRPCP